MTNRNSGLMEENRYGARMFRILAAIGLLLGGCQPTPARPTTSGTSPAGDRATVTTIVDGDSFEATVGGRTEEVRMLGINAPESNECFAEESLNALTSSLEGADLVLVAGGDDNRDSFGRLLRYVYVGGRNLNETMLVDGLAVVLQSDHHLNDEFVAVAQTAADGGLGLWAADACGPSARQEVRVTRVEYDPPGPDDGALNGEYVDIVNEGSVVADLAGWTLRDESSLHRYRFDQALQPGEQLRVRTGCGDDRNAEVFWCSEQPIWSNGGDTAILQDEHGNVVSWLTYRGG